MPRCSAGAGYRTFFAGKWHLGDTGADPEDFGFEINKGGWKVGWPMGGYFAPWDNPKLDPGPDGESLPLRLGRETVRFISDHRDQPFLAYLSFYSVHGPIQTSRERWARFRAKAAALGAPKRRFRFDGSRPVRLVEDCPVYAGMIEAMDEAVGLVLDAPGPASGWPTTRSCAPRPTTAALPPATPTPPRCYPCAAARAASGRAAFASPCTSASPGVVKPGTTCEAPVSGIDFYPTLLELAGLELPAKQEVDGHSMVGLLQGRHDPAISERDLFWHYPHYGNQGGDPSSTIRHGPWKLIHYHEDGHDELYHLEADPGERHDVLRDQRGTADGLWRRLQRWLDETGAKFPVPDPQYDAAGEQEFLHRAAHELMPELEARHSAYLDPDWQPNADWWGQPARRRLTYVTPSHVRLPDGRLSKADRRQPSLSYGLGSVARAYRSRKSFRPDRSVPRIRNTVRRASAAFLPRSWRYTEEVGMKRSVIAAPRAARTVLGSEPCIR